MPELSPYFFDDRLMFVGAALLANFVLFGSRTVRKAFGLNTPRKYLRQQLTHYERKLNRNHRSPRDRTMRGLFVLVVMIALTGFVAANISALTATHHWGWLAEVALLALFIPQRKIYTEGKIISELLQQKELARARKIAKRLTLRETSNLDDHAVVRTTIEYKATSFITSVISPIFWYIILGLPGFVAIKILSEASLLLGYASVRFGAYGRAARKLDILLSIIPTLLGDTILLLSTCFVPKANPFAAAKAWSTDALKFSAPQKGSAIAIVAGGLGISLGGPRSVRGVLIKDAWVGTGSAKTTLYDLEKMNLLYMVSCLICAGLTFSFIWMQT